MDKQKVSSIFASVTPNESSTWVYWVVIEKKGDKVVDAEWNAFHIEGDTNTTYKGMDKVSCFKAHIYDMNSDYGGMNKLRISY